ncbi:FeoA family protein [Tropicimonas sp. IMCC34043]|uniref:FeoA family protein n=1 Tax=Tropicimonas sp. IMCC34043 TaxID=2248760 RepID=UPI000E251C99|nr:FeoA family protein [Tropicimonas sp. IMCC34043]
MSLAGLPLSLAPCGTLKVTAIAGDLATRGQLQDMGIQTGKRLQLLQSEMDEGVVIALGDTRVALGQDLARRILVTPVEKGR